MILCVGSVKGGVGKSTLASNLAVALSATKSVLLIDGDAQAPRRCSPKRGRNVSAMRAMPACAPMTSRSERRSMR